MQQRSFVLAEENVVILLFSDFRALAWCCSLLIGLLSHVADWLLVELC